MRWFMSPLVATSLPFSAFCVFSVFGSTGACSPQLPRTGAVAPVNCQPLPGMSASASVATTPVPSSTPLLAEPLPSPSSGLRLDFLTPKMEQEIPLEAASTYQVQLSSETEGERGAFFFDVALDGGRPRRLAPPLATVALGQLVAADALLNPGPHWLFAAPVLASGLVPRTGPGSARVAVARRFFVGPQEHESGLTGALWLRKPEGTYNGAAAAHDVLFDVFVFSAAGAPQDLPYAVALHGPNVSGDLRFPSPFIVHDLPSGDYDVVVSATAHTLSARFAVNRELGGAP